MFHGVGVRSADLGSEAALCGRPGEGGDSQRRLFLRSGRRVGMNRELGLGVDDKNQVRGKFSIDT